MVYKRAYANKKKKMKKRVYKRKYKNKKRNVSDVVIRSTPIRTPFPDEFVCKLKSFVTFKMQSQGSALTYCDARFDNSAYTLGRYENGSGVVDMQPIGGKWTQEGASQLGALYNNYVVTSFKLDLIVENNDAASLVCYTFPYYPGQNLNGPTIPFTTTIEDDPRVKKQYINPQTQGTSKRVSLKNYVTPYYSYKNGYIKGDKGWSALVSSDPSLNYGIGMRLASFDRTGIIDTNIVVSGYITHYVKFFNKKGTN